MTLWQRFKAAVARWAGAENVPTLAEGKQPEAKQPEATQPEATQPEATQPEAKQPEVKQPEAKQPQPIPPNPGPQRQIPVMVAYTKASIVLAGLPDPYNPAVTQESIARNRQIAEASEAGQFARVVKSVIAFVPYVGPIVTALSQLFDAIGNEILKQSKGGFDNLPVLTKKRIAIYFWAQQGSKYKCRFPSTVTPPTKPTNSLPDAQYRSEYETWLRNYLLYSARKQETERIVRTEDEVMLPEQAINFLNEADLWPPPLEPMPLTYDEWAKAFPDYRKFFYYLPPEIDSNLAEINKRVYDTLQSDYRHDINLYSAGVAKLGTLTLPAELKSLAENNGMIPRLGSFGNPQTVASRAARF